MKIETRFIPIAAAEFRAQDKEGGGWKLRALGVPFNALSVDLGGYRERFAPDAFSDLGKNDVYSTFNHNPSSVLGRVSAGNLSLSAKKDGLFYEVEPTDTSYGRDLKVNVEARVVKGSSIMFVVLEGGDIIEKMKVDGTEIVVRTVTDAELFELGPVTDPAYVQTTAEAAARMEQRVRQWLEAQAPAAAYERDRTAELRLRRMELDLLD
jgi:uncharacterized protein